MYIMLHKQYEDYLDGINNLYDDDDDIYGHWICILMGDDYDQFKCSKCGRIAEELEMFGHRCPGCESRMIPYDYGVEYDEDDE